MIYYSTVPLEVVYAEESSPEESQIKEVEIDGVAMVIRMLSSTEAQVERLLSPNPQDYLNPRYYPGSRIRLVPSWR